MLTEPIFTVDYDQKLDMFFLMSTETVTGLTPWTIKKVFIPMNINSDDYIPDDCSYVEQFVLAYALDMVSSFDTFYDALMAASLLQIVGYSRD